MSVPEELRQKVIYLRDVMKLTFPQIGEKTGTSRKKASKIYHGDYRKRGRPERSLLDKYFSLIANWFKEYPGINAKQIYVWLKERQVDIGYDRVAQYTKQFRKRKVKIYHPLEFLPGEEGQVDWFFVNHPRIGKLSCFVMVLSYSRYLFAFAFLRSSFEFFIEGHLKAFSTFKGTPHCLRYDNLKSVVLKLKPEPVYNPRFMEFSRHYKFEIHLCNPYAGNEKGRVERANRTIKETFFNIAENYSSIEALNRGLQEWIKNKNETVHRTTDKKPADLLPEEKLRPLPAIPWENITIHPPVKTTKTGMIIFDNNRYSVPDYLTGKALAVYSSPATINIYDGDKRIASHKRVFERNKEMINPLHRTYVRLSAHAKTQRVYEVIKNMDPVVSDFLTNNEAAGEDPQKTAYTIFKLMKSHSRGMLLSVLRECLSRKSARLKTLLSYLHQEPQMAGESVYPQNKELLEIDYQKRSLEEYENE